MAVWYSGYGSNLSPRRFGYYLRGGRPDGARRVLPGCRDRSSPTAERALRFPGDLFFGWDSPTWGGGVAFVDAEGDGVVLARAYRITEQQFSDVVAQEMHRQPSADLDLATVLRDRRHDLGPGHYESLRLVGELDGEAVLTFTAPDPDALSSNPPAAPYLRVMLDGLVLTHGLSIADAASYLAGLPGVGHWTPARIAALAGG